MNINKLELIDYSDATLRQIASDAVDLGDTNNITDYVGYYIIAELQSDEVDGESEIDREIVIAINKWHDEDGKRFDIYMRCEDNNTFETVWVDWNRTETQDEAELFEKLKEIRDNIRIDSFFENEELKWFNELFDREDGILYNEERR